MSLNPGLDSAMAQPDEALAIWFEGTRYTWQQIRAFSDALEALLANNGVGPGRPIGILCRNNPPHAAALLSAIRVDRPIVMIYTLQSIEGVANDIRTLGLPAIFGLAGDWTDGVVAAAREAGTLGLRTMGRENLELSLQPGLETLGANHRNQPPVPLTISVLSSGTTGKPKLVQVSSHIFSQALATMSVADLPGVQVRPNLAFTPISNISGLIQFLGSVARGGCVFLLERFEIERWLTALDACEPDSIIMFAPMIHAFLEHEVPRERFGGLRAVFGGAGPLAPEVQYAFEDRYGIPVYWGYGCTEIAGTAANWTPELAEQFGRSKPGSAGRALKGVNLRIVDPDTGEELPRGEMGLVEAQVDLLGPDWIRTTDLAVIDEDDFLFLRGRADQAINRGGFKILPEKIASAVAEHPAVLDAVAFGIADSRLGQVPVVAVQLTEGASLSEDDLIAFLRTKLAAYAVPTQVLFMSEIPRTGALKPDLPALKRAASEAAGQPA
ncbi:MAG TPA: class I adenylate-forming enzyme family protein [Novosphingobium sp.]|nr:class I adenylate-forming enzyme family protein [Novosphingobium sp.]